ncbi:FAD-dependent oxidoreductase [uncultured Ferrovibrio sp.]|jgi:succinate dehydrogenase/fumarate reductase flavoprotein subunit|uniref:FAD-dependent oxidoreductase n=1 Tax=uncultured Ferrovibrio sp. TaxID=1576913 RepID=UPI002610A246|nr:FAD-dependent oxidoreductase [uncultured Ferrovibrio sp.]
MNALNTSIKTHDCDLLVVGSGAGGMAAAITAKLHGLDVLIVEKESVYGGTTARSGGWLWIPANPLAAREGIKDSKEAARTYLQHEAGNHFDAERVDAFLENGPRMVDFFESKTAVKFVLGPQFSDYHPDAPGALPGGRSICAEPFDGRELGDKIKTLRPPLAEITFVGMMIGSGKELLHFFNVTRSVVSAAYVAKLLVKYGRDLLTHGRAMRLTNGNALAGRLAKTAFDLGIPLWLNAPAGELIKEGDRVAGAIVQTQDGPVRVRAKRGVVLATGGFPHDIARRAKLYPHAPTGAEHWSPTPEGNTGDGIKLAASLGATTADELPNAAAWVPVSRVPRRDGSFGVFPHFIDRAKPGVIAVTRAGTRFVNEGNCYHDFCQALVKAHKNLPGEICAWLICDHPTLRRYGLGHVKPFPVPIAHQLKNGYLKRGKTLAELAKVCGIDPVAFERTVAEFNKHARKGEDPQFGKGSTAYNRYLGDPTVTPNPCVAPVETGPFYAVQLVIGDLGSFAGLKADAQARVLDSTTGQPIPGLYAAGNDMASIMGGNYPGGGITLGPAMTFGYIAGRHAAGVTD